MNRRSRRRQSLKSRTSALRNQNADRNNTAASDANVEQAYRGACGLAERGEFDRAKSVYQELAAKKPPARLAALIENDLGTLEFLAGNASGARAHLVRAVIVDPACEVSRHNLTLIDLETRPVQPTPAAIVANHLPIASGATRVAIVSLLFNWPSTGGGTVHTAEAGKFLSRAGYDVKHFYAQYAGWGVGNVTLPLDHPATALVFEDADWNAWEIQRRFRDAVDLFAPDFVIITDSWNSKPLLAEAMRGYRYFLRLAAMECLCPLNNVRLLIDNEGQIASCPRHQLATADVCQTCVARRQHQSGSLHQAERALAGYGTSEYDRQLRRAFAEAEGVLVVNPLIGAMVSPYAKSVHVVPSGFDPERFPWPWPEEPCPRPNGSRTQIFFAGLTNEYMKGFHVAHAACRNLWRVRKDFELVVTGDPAGETDEFTRYIGWQSQADLPRRLREADMLVFPTVAEEALGRSAVEAMGVGRAVIASRIGGLPFTVSDGTTGLLFEPGNVDDLTRQMTRLLDDPALRERMGQAGRQKFEQEFAWPVVIDRQYKQLLKKPEPVKRAYPAFVPSFPERIDRPRLVAEISEFLEMSPSEIERMLATYQAFHDRQGYAAKFGEFKTLNFEEAFVMCLVSSLIQPQAIIEIGTGAGRSARRIVDFLEMLGMQSRVASYDVVDDVPYVSRDEVELVCQDVTGRFRTQILEKYGSGLLFLDVHPYALLHEAVTETLAFPGDWTIVVHDCGSGLCNPHMTLARDDPHVTSHTGVWERHVLAEAFGIADPRSDQLDQAQTGTHRLRIFSTLHGLGLITAGRATTGRAPSPIPQRETAPCP